jgi:hypothetical protein
MLDPESPLYIRPRASKSFLAWLYRFWRACNASSYDAGMATTAESLRTTDDLMRQWQQAGIALETHDFGRLIAYQEKHVMESDLAAYTKMAAFGVSQPEPMYGDDLHAFESMLSQAITAAYYLRGEVTM